MVNLEDTVFDLTTKLAKKGVRANVLVKTRTHLPPFLPYLQISVKDIDESQSKKACSAINEAVLEFVGYGMSVSNYENNTLAFEYTPLREAEPKQGETYHAAGCE